MSMGNVHGLLCPTLVRTATRWLGWYCNGSVITRELHQNCILILPPNTKKHCLLKCHVTKFHSYYYEMHCVLLNKWWINFLVRFCFWIKGSLVIIEQFTNCQIILWTNQPKEVKEVSYSLQICRQYQHPDQTIITQDSAVCSQYSL